MSLSFHLQHFSVTHHVFYFCHLRFSYIAQTGCSDAHQYISAIQEATAGVWGKSKQHSHIANTMTSGLCNMSCEDSNKWTYYSQPFLYYEALWDSPQRFSSHARFNKHLGDYTPHTSMNKFWRMELPGHEITNLVKLLRHCPKTFQNHWGLSRATQGFC